jgi:hypothetical protein
LAILLDPQLAKKNSEMMPNIKCAFFINWNV